MPRLFLAVEIPEQIKLDLKRYINKFKPIITGKFVRLENIHITLKFFGEADPAKITSLLSDLKLRKFQCEIKGVGIFPNARFPKVLWFGIDKGHEEFARLAAAASISALEYKEKEFHAHATVCRIKKAKLGRLMDLLNNYKTTSFGSFEVNEFVLVESKLTPDGPVYKTVKKFPLT